MTWNWGASEKSTQYCDEPRAESIPFNYFSFFHTKEKLTALNLLLTQFEVDFHIVLWSDIDRIERKREREVREKSLRSEIVIHALIVINF